MDQGQTIWNEGEEVDSMVLVFVGPFRKEGRFGRATAPSGAMLGAWEILSESHRTESWRAESSSRAPSMRKHPFIDLLEDHFDFAQSHLKRTAERTFEA